MLIGIEAERANAGQTGQDPAQNDGGPARARRKRQRDEGRAAAAAFRQPRRARSGVAERRANGGIR